MDSVNDILSSVSGEDIEKLKSVAADLMKPTENKTPEIFGGMLDGETSQMLLKVVSQLNKESSKTQLIKALSPLLSEERRKRAEEAAKFLKLMDALPIIRGMFR